jgi:REP element-mobilizing transposase RayT
MSEEFYRRRLPHWQPDGATIFFTWRLHGSLPREAVERLIEERERLERRSHRPGEVEHERAARHNKLILAMADEILGRAEYGPLWLQDPRTARLMTDAFFHFDGQRYDLFSFVVMPNHVHALLRPKEIQHPEENAPRFVPIRQITQGLKGYVAREANRLLGRTGQAFWQIESYDHWARGEAEAMRIAGYIESDPVRCGLVKHPADWRWSSAWERERGQLVGRPF